MCSRMCYIGVPVNFEGILAKHDYLNAQVVRQMNDTQQLIMLNAFSHESNEHEIRKCIQDRLAEVASWKWVLQDLSKRLEEATAALCHEHKALNVIVVRLETEINDFSNKATRPGALVPHVDAVETAILEERDYLRGQKKTFKKMISSLELQIRAVDRTRRLLNNDVLSKERSMTLDEKCMCLEGRTVDAGCECRKTRKRATPVIMWHDRCQRLKRAGLNALNLAIAARQQIRGARQQLSTLAHAHAVTVDAALRRRLHNNKAKLDELLWQQSEVGICEMNQDRASLKQELTTAEMNLSLNLEHIIAIEMKISDRNLRPRKERTKDDIAIRLKAELGRVRKFSNEMRVTIKNIHGLQAKLVSANTKVENLIYDLKNVISLDESRIAARQSTACATSGAAHSSVSSQQLQEKHIGVQSSLLETIVEASENDNIEENCSDYPFDY